MPTATLERPERASAPPISIDDFGTGHSSLGRSSGSPIDELKIDRSLIRADSSGRATRPIVRSTIHLAHQMGLQVVAEGVETEDAWRQLRSMGCERGPGLPDRRAAAGPRVPRLARDLEPARARAQQSREAAPGAKPRARSVQRGRRPPSSARAVVRPLPLLGRRGQQHPAGRLLQHVLGHLADLVRAARRRCRPRIAPPRIRVGGSPPITITSAPLSRASWTIPDPIERARTRFVVTSTFSYSSPTSRARSSARSASLLHRLRQRRVERHRQRQLGHVDDVQPRRPLPLLHLGVGEPARGADDVVVELGAEHRHQDGRVLHLGRLLLQRGLRHLNPLWSAASPPRSAGRSRRRRARTASSRRRRRPPCGAARTR